MGNVLSSGRSFFSCVTLAEIIFISNETLQKIVCHGYSVSHQQSTRFTKEKVSGNSLYKCCHVWDCCLRWWRQPGSTQCTCERYAFAYSSEFIVKIPQFWHFFFLYQILKLLLNVSEWKWHLFYSFIWSWCDLKWMWCRWWESARSLKTHVTHREEHISAVQCLSWMFLSCRCWLFHHANKTFDWIKNVFEIKKWTTIISHADPTKIVLELVFVARHKFLLYKLKR